MGGQNPYADSALHYFKAGWLAPIPLPYRKKNPPPGGFIGYRGKDPDLDQINEWCDELHNIAIRMADVETNGNAYEVIGIDTDDYRKGEKLKTGHAQLQKLIERLGPLPETWTSSARTDGKSGIRYFLVESGLRFAGKAAKDIDVIWKCNRFAAVWPSIHPEGMTYWWYPQGPGIVGSHEVRTSLRA